MSCGLEARISGVLGDAALTFFDPLYAINRDRYSPGTIAEVELAAIAYSMQIVPRGTKLKPAVGEVPMDGAAVLVSARKRGSEQLADAAGDGRAYGVAYIEQDSYPLPDDYQFCAPVKDVQNLKLIRFPPGSSVAP